jgi:uncharacterized membrane protein YesL
MQNLNTVPKVEGEILALKSLIERRAVCIAYCSVVYLMYKLHIFTQLSYNSLPKFWCEKLAKKVLRKIFKKEVNK